MQPTRLTTRTHPALRILVVDDEESICTVLARTLAPLGYPVDVALDADSALEVMKERPAEVALVDIRMPGRDGVWLIERIQKEYPATAIIIVTGILDLDPRVSLRPGVVGYLTKPFEGDRVREAVEEAVAQLRSQPRGGSARARPEPLAERQAADPEDVDDKDVP